MNAFRAPSWQWGGNAQTIWPALYSRSFEGPRPRFERERWTTPDGDFIDVDFLERPAQTPPAGTLVLFHGLEGSSGSHYALAFAHRAREHNLAFVVPHFRGCSGELNHGPRAYHSGDFEEIGWVLQRLRARAAVPLWAVGISLGGNALMRWAQEAGESAAATARAVVAVSSPLDLSASGAAIDRGFNRHVYARMFLRTMKPKALRKLLQHPGLFDAQRLRAAQTIFEFDDVFTAPLHGFKNTPDYWQRAAAAPRMADIRIPALALNALNDPFVPAHSLPQPGQVGRHVTLWQPAHGGHVGFGTGPGRGHVMAMPDAVLAWLAQQA